MKCSGPVLFLLAASLWSSAQAAEVPSSSRSRKVIEKVRADLVRDLDGKSMSLGSPVFIRIFKESRELELWVEEGGRFKLFRSYPICYFSGDPGPKTATGDLQSPEGFYFVTPGRMNPFSRYHLSFDLGYPNKYDRSHGRDGSALMVHGDCVSIGCYAMGDENIEEIYALAHAALEGGQPYFRVHIFPFRMTDERMQKEKNAKWRGFWTNLKEGYDIFEETGKVPCVEVENGRYIFEEEN